MAKAKSKRSFEELMEDLEQRLARMEGGALSLDEMLKEYAAGMELIALCRDKLSAARQLIENTPDATTNREEAQHDGA